MVFDIGDLKPVRHEIHSHVHTYTHTDIHTKQLKGPVNETNEN